MKGRVALVALALSLAAFGAAQSGGFGGGQSSSAAPVTVATVKAGEAIPAETLRYRVLRIQSGLKEYVQRYDQNRVRMRPGFESDQLVVVELEVENVGEQSLDPTTFGFKLIDSEGGVSSFGLYDARLQSKVVAAGVPDAMATSRAEVAPGGKSKIAMVFSVPPSARAKGIEVYRNFTTITQGAVVHMPGYLVAKAELDKG
jgi:hypothetical protein